MSMYELNPANQRCILEKGGKSIGQLTGKFKSAIFFLFFFPIKG